MMKIWFKFKNGQLKGHIITDIWIQDEGDRSIIAIKKKNGTILYFEFQDIEEIRTPRRVGIRGRPTFAKISDLAFLLQVLEKTSNSPPKKK